MPENNTKTIADMILEYYPNDYNGILIEVGAGFPEMGSPILPIRKKGWNIISVEPNPVLCNEFKELNLPILEYAAYNEDIGETEFVVYPNGLSSSCLKLLVSKNSNWVREGKDEYNSNSGLANNLSKNFDWEFFPRAGKTKTIKVIALTLNTILKQNYPLLEKLDVMIVDVEGCEIEVMQGIDLKKYNPKVIVLENLDSNPMYRTYMELNNFVLDNRIYIDDFYIRKDK